MGIERAAKYSTTKSSTHGRASSKLAHSTEQAGMTKWLSQQQKHTHDQPPKTKVSVGGPAHMHDRAAKPSEYTQLLVSKHDQAESAHHKLSQQ